MENTWINTDTELPICSNTGNWDGKQSDLVLAETIDGEQFIGQCYEGIQYGEKFFDWYQVDEINKNDWLITKTISRWMKIPF